MKETLTTREIEVLQLKADGLMAVQIAERLGISRNTVRTHMEHVRIRLGAFSTPHAVAIALREGWIK